MTSSRRTQIREQGPKFPFQRCTDKKKISGFADCSNSFSQLTATLDQFTAAIGSLSLCQMGNFLEKQLKGVQLPSKTRRVRHAGLSARKDGNDFCTLGKLCLQYDWQWSCHDIGPR